MARELAVIERCLSYYTSVPSTRVAVSLTILESPLWVHIFVCESYLSDSRYLLFRYRLTMRYVLPTPKDAL